MKQRTKRSTNCQPVGDESSKPVRRGKLYCSPACGCCCTKTAYDKAYRASVTLVMLLKGGGWLGEVLIEVERTAILSCMSEARWKRLPIPVLVKILSIVEADALITSNIAKKIETEGSP